MSSTPEQVQQQRIDAEADRLRELLVRFVLETALSQPRFKDVITDMEEVVKVARAGSGKDIEAMRETLRGLQTSVAEGASRSAEDVRQLKELVTAASKRSGQLMTDLGKRLAVLERPSRGGESLDEDTPSRRRAGLSVRDIAIAGTAVAMGAVGMLGIGTVLGWGQGGPTPPVAVAPPACTMTNEDGSCSSSGGVTGTPRPLGAAATGGAQSTSSSSAPASAHPVVWETLWSSALSQPAVCGGGAKDKPVAFAKCFCPEVALALGETPSPDVARSCAWDVEKAKKWTDRQAVGALQAVLRVSKRLNDTVDGGMGTDTGRALEKLISQCTDMGPEAAAAQKTLVEKEDKPLSEARKKERALARSTAAVKLLGLLQAHPSCLGMEVSEAPPKGTKTGGDAAVEHPHGG